MSFNSKILFASSNKGKFQEVKQLAARHNLSILGINELGLSSPPEVEETGQTYLENARLKAEAFFLWSNVPCLADDTGLEVDLLDGKPGVFTARYAGEKAGPKDNMKKLLEVMGKSENRSARFRCILYLMLNKEKFVTSEATLEGSIARSAFGDGGFGYDPIFIVGNTGKTLAELKALKETVETHRTLALKKIFEKLK